MKSGSMTTLRFGPYSVQLSNEDKILFPDEAITKGAVVDYYVQIAEAMLPHVRGRPLTMHRFPDGIDHEGFYQKAIGGYFPGWIRRATVEKEDGQVTHVVCENAATLAYLANQACITPHVWLSRADRPRHPDRMIFDLDPSGHDFGVVREVARALVDLLDDLGLAVFLQTTGSRGIHVVVPLDRSADFEASRRFARDVADLVARRMPDRATTEIRKKKRGERLFIDVMRNGYAQTAVAPYAIRPKSGAPVATPIDRSELSDADLRPDGYTIRNIFSRLARRSDPWSGMGQHARSLTEPRRRLDRRVKEGSG